MSSEQLELTEGMIMRNDEIDSAVQDCICILAEKELDWDMEIIENVTEAIKSSLENHDIKVRHPEVATNEHGMQYYKEYDISKKNTKLKELAHIVDDIKQVISDEEIADNGKPLVLCDSDMEAIVDEVLGYDYSDYNNFIREKIEELIDLKILLLNDLVQTKDKTKNNDNVLSLTDRYVNKEQDIFQHIYGGLCGGDTEGLLEEESQEMLFIINDISIKERTDDYAILSQEGKDYKVDITIGTEGCCSPSEHFNFNTIIEYKEKKN